MKLQGDPGLAFAWCGAAASATRRRAPLAAARDFSLLNGVGWASLRLTGDRFLVRQKPAGRWMMPLGSPQGAATFAHPMERLDVPALLGVFYFMSGRTEELLTATILSPDEWEACSVHWRPPSWKVCTWSDVRQRVARFHCARAFPLSAPMPLVQACAQLGFFGLSFHELTSIAKNIGLTPQDISNCTSLELLDKMSWKVLPWCTDTKVSHVAVASGTRLSDHGGGRGIVGHRRCMGHDGPGRRDGAPQTLEGSEGRHGRIR